ncbi:DNA topoisomerase IB [uncultured Microbacterium sp.]|uniref:DNA topoisomerase IB n=1 Tax=uncultured Microbacterium sp. TaxID=191216 RepID=UPI0025FD7F31|nr:DNA topoisomerase IB [uncultured Microbacterium sp.]
MLRLNTADPAHDLGYARTRAGRGFSYATPRGATPNRRDRARIDALVLPPAWTDVWIARDPLAHIQAVGTDEAGRRQYRYHEAWSAGRAKKKFVRALALAEALPRARGRVTTALRRPQLDRERVLAVAFRLLDAGAPRVGSARYLVRHGSRGLTTLKRSDATVSGDTVTLSFRAKGGVQAHLEITDADLARAVDELRRGRPSAQLLAYRKGGRRVGIDASDVNAHVCALTGGPFTAKDFRTLRGTVVAAMALAVAATGCAAKPTKRERESCEREAVKAAALALGNTVAVARSSYIDPRIFLRYTQGRLISEGRTPEAALRELLA